MTKRKVRTDKYIVHFQDKGTQFLCKSVLVYATGVYDALHEVYKDFGNRINIISVELLCE